MKKKLTILHSNDLHGDFLEEKDVLDDKYTGGLSYLAGYVNKVRTEEPNTIYAIAGDMFRGSVIDSEYRGISTIEMMNLVAPDIVCLGNHELDYGLSHLLFLEKCARFPIINANLFITTTGTRLFQPHKILNIDGMKILFIGIVTEETMKDIKMDPLLGTFVDTDDAVIEVERIINSYKTEDIDLTVLLTHIGFEEDQQLASKLPPELGVDIIIGGHSHTFPEKPAEVNDILIVQAGTGTDQVGRFDIEVDTDTNSVASWKWGLYPVDTETAQKDAAIEQRLKGYKSQTDEKYGRILTRFDHILTHPQRCQETELGNMFADIIYDMLKPDIVLMGSGSLRKTVLGEAVTMQDLMEFFPYKGKVFLAPMQGSTFRKAMQYMLRDGFDTEHFEFYQVSRNVRITYNRTTKVIDITVDGVPIDDGKVYNVAIQEYHFKNVEECLGIPTAEIEGYPRCRVITTSDYDVVEEYFNTHAHLTAYIDGRITINS